MMATNGSFNTSSREGRYLTFSWTLDSQSTSGNYSNISWELKGGGTSGYVYCGDFEVTIDGTVVYSSETRIQVYNTTSIKKGSLKVYHGNDGTKTLTASVKCAIYTYDQDRTGSGSWSLTAIPRYPSVTQTLASKEEKKIQINWSSDSTINRVRYKYSSNGGSTWSNWTSITISNKKSGSFTITGLSAYTSYKIVTEVRRSDSGLTAESSALTVKTYDFPNLTSMRNCIIGEQLYFTVYNPLGRTYQMTLIYADGYEVFLGAFNYTDFTTSLGTGHVERLYASIPNSKTGQFQVKIVYDTNTSTKTGGTYTIDESLCIPDITSLQYADVNSNVTAITQNNQLIVQNISVVEYMAGGLQAKKSATISSVTLLVNSSGMNMNVSGSGATVTATAPDSGSDLEITAIITDSRGLTNSKTVTMTMLEWAIPYANYELNRQSNYYSETDLTVKADYSYIDGKNDVTIKYRIKDVTNGGDWNEYTVIQNTTLVTFTADNLSEWQIEIVVTDLFGGTATYYAPIPIGVPILYIDRLQRSIGINGLTDQEGQFSVGIVDMTIDETQYGDLANKLGMVIPS